MAVAADNTASMMTNETSQMTALTQEAVLDFLHNLPTDEYQQMAEAWGKLTSEEDFSQA